MFRLMVRILTVLLFTAISLTEAFNADGYYSDMPIKLVKEKLSSMGFDRIEDEQDQISASFEKAKDSGQIYIFTFQDDKLAYFQKCFEPSVERFIIMGGEFRAQFGNLVYMRVENRNLAIGPYYSMSLEWVSGKEHTTLTYKVLPTNHSLDVIYEDFPFEGMVPK